MKHFAKVLLALAAAALLASCGSAPAPANTPAPTKKGPALEVIEHQGTLRGQDWPAWIDLDEAAIEAAAENGETGFAPYKDKVMFKVERTGANQRGIEVLAENMNAASTVAKMISLRVQNLFSGAEIGDDKNVETYFENVTKTLAEATVTGFKKESSWWVHYKYVESGKEEYRVYMLFSIPKKTIEKLMNDALGQETPESPEKQTAKDRVKAIMQNSLPALTGEQRGL